MINLYFYSKKRRPKCGFHSYSNSTPFLMNPLSPDQYLPSSSNHSYDIIRARSILFDLFTKGEKFLAGFPITVFSNSSIK